MAKRGVAGGLMKKPTQKEEVLAYMRNYGSISTFIAVAWGRYGKAKGVKGT